MAVIALVPLFSWIGSSLGTAAVTSGVVTGASVGGAAAIGSAIGTVAGAVAGSYIDQTYIYPLLQKKQNTSGPKLDDLSVQTASEGSGMFYCLGKENRIAGTIIWVSDLIQVKNETHVEGGKGGGGGASQTSYDYYLDVAIGVCEGPIAGIDKIWADSKLIYDSDGSLTDTGTATGYTLTSFQPMGDENLNIGGGSGTFAKGDLIQIGGTGPTYKVATDYGGGTGTLIIEHPGVEYDVHTGDSVAIVSHTDSGENGKDPRAHLIRIYRGTGNQVADSILEGYLGAGKVPGFRDTAYVVISGLLLRDFGNRCPQFSFLVRTQDHESCAGAISNVLERQGLSFDLGEYNVDLVPHSIRGYAINGITNAIQQIEPIMQGYDLLVTESNSSLKFFGRGYETVVQVYPNDLNATEGHRTGAGSPFTITDPSGFDLPREVNVKFIDPTVDWQSGNARYQRNDGLTNQVEQLDVPLVMHPDDAQNLAATRLWRSFSERMQVELSLPPKYIHLEENDIVKFAYNGETYSVRLNEVNIGANFMIACKGVLVGMEDADETLDCGRRPSTPQPVQQSVQLTPVVLDVPALSDAEVETAGVYVAASTFTAAASFRGAGVFVSSDNVNFTQVDSLSAPATSGRATNALPSGTPGIWDTVNTVTVNMLEGDLSSATEDRVLNGANRAWLGQELIAWKTATLIAPGQYTLSGLLRGLRATDTTGHLIGDKFLVVSSNTVKFTQLNNSAAGTNRYFKFVQPDQTIAGVPTWIVPFKANTLRQPAPIVNSFARDGSDNLSLAWTRRTRYNTPLFANYQPLGADAEKYEIDFYEGTTLRSTKTSTTPSYSYTAAARATDGFSSSAATVTAVIYMINEKVGRGYPVTVSA